MLVTRPRDRSPAFAAELQARGAIAVIAPVISIQPPDDDGPLRRAAEQIDAFDWCVFSSANGVDAFMSLFVSTEDAVRRLGRVRLAAVGPHTAARLERYGPLVAVVPEEHVAEGLTAAISAHARRGARVLIVGAQDARDALPEGLRAAGFHPLVVAAYRTAYVADLDFATNANGVDAITFASASAVRGFVAAAGGLERARALAAGKVVACIGPIAANAATDAGLTVDVVAASYTGTGLIDALASCFAARS